MGLELIFRERTLWDGDDVVSNEIERLKSFVFALGTVDGRNPAPPGIYKSLQIVGYLPYQLVQDFNHQQYHLDFFWL